MKKKIVKFIIFATVIAFGLTGCGLKPEFSENDVLEIGTQEESHDDRETVSFTVEVSDSEEETEISVSVEEEESEEVVQEPEDIVAEIYENYIATNYWNGFTAVEEKIAMLNDTIGDEGYVIYMFDDNATGTGKGVGYYYNEEYNYGVWYVGDYVDFVRSGSGVGYSMKSEGDVLYVDQYDGTWQNDILDGSATTFIYPIIM